MEILAKGAEANLYVDGGRLVKERVAKKYRIAELDVRLRRQRTRREAKNLVRASEAGVRVPKLLKADEKNFRLEMEYVRGELVKDAFERDERTAELAEAIGRMLRRLHDGGIVHNDLTTSNIIASEGGVCMIDFGLAYHTERLEDLAMDLVVFKKSIQATHTVNCDKIWGGLLKGYSPGNDLLTRVATIEGRVRYK